MSQVWYIEQADGSITGPLPEKQICGDLLSGRIDLELRVRQGSSGPWVPASRARELFRQLAESGWYICVAEKIFGPFTSGRLLELHRAGEIAADAKLRQGTGGTWKAAAELFAVWASQAAEVVATDTQRNQIGSSREREVTAKAAVAAREVVQHGAAAKWSVEPIRHYALPLEQADRSVVGKCHAWERLFLQRAQNVSDERLSVCRSNRQSVGALNVNNSRQLLTNQQRGISHIVLFSERPGVAEVIVILCPPGTTEEDSRQYIDVNFALPLTKNA